MAQCSSCGQIYHCDLHKNQNYFDFNQFKRYFTLPEKSILI